MSTIVCYLKNFFRPNTAKPIKPEPKRSMLAGSGTAEKLPAVSAIKELPPLANNNKTVMIIIDNILMHHL